MLTNWLHRTLKSFSTCRPIGMNVEQDYIALMRGFETIRICNS
jgi:hypothetical protein